MERLQQDLLVDVVFDAQIALQLFRNRTDGSVRIRQLGCFSVFITSLQSLTALNPFDF